MNSPIWITSTLVAGATGFLVSFFGAFVAGSTTGAAGASVAVVSTAGAGVMFAGFVATPDFLFFLDMILIICLKLLLILVTYVTLNNCTKLYN